MSKTNAAFMSGVPELLVLRLLLGREMYGYEIVRGVRLATRDAIILAEGVVYPTLHSLEKRGFLKSSSKKVEGRTRVYYSLTAKGRKRFEDLSSQWEKITNGISSCLEPGHVQ